MVRGKSARLLFNGMTVENVWLAWRMLPCPYVKKIKEIITDEQ